MYDVDVLHYIDPSVEQKWKSNAKALGVRAAYGVENESLNNPVTLGQFITSIVRKLPVSSVKYIRQDFSKRFLDMAGHYEIVHVDTIHLTGKVVALKQLSRPPLTVLNAHNVECQIAGRMKELESSLSRRLALAIHARNMARFERRAFSSADMVLAVSDEDMERINAMAGIHGKAVLVENGVDENYYKPGIAENVDPNSLVFVGSMDWLPNVDGVKWFVSEILPSIRLQCPQARLTIVGRNPNVNVTALHSPHQGIVVTGTVDDVRPYVRHAAVFVVPLRFGGGSRLKILEAFAMKKAVVSTRLGAEGIQCQCGHHLCIEDEPQSFAKACLSLMGDCAFRNYLGAAGYNFALSRYTWSAVIRRMQEAVFSRLERGRDPDAY